MQVNCSYHQVDHSKALDSFVAEKLQRMERFFGKNDSVKCVVSRDGKEYKFLVHYNAHGQMEHIQAHHGSVYKSVSLGAQKLKERLREFKSRKASHR